MLSEQNTPTDTDYASDMKDIKRVTSLLENGHGCLHPEQREEKPLSWSVLHRGSTTCLPSQPHSIGQTNGVIPDHHSLTPDRKARFLSSCIKEEPCVCDSAQDIKHQHPPTLLSVDTQSQFVALTHYKTSTSPSVSSCTQTAVGGSDRSTSSEDCAHTCVLCRAGFDSWEGLSVHLQTHGVLTHHEQLTGQLTQREQDGIESALNTQMVTYSTDKHRTGPGLHYTATVTSDHTIPMMTNTGVKPNTCYICSRSFSRGSHLKRHMMIHTGEKPYECSVCGYRCRIREHLNSHMRTHTGERPYECSQCGRRFSQASYLTRHQRAHKGEKPYMCSECNRAFVWPGDLRRHMKNHTGETPYTCSQCGRHFTRKGSLMGHMRTHILQTSAARDNYP